MHTNPLKTSPRVCSLWGLWEMCVVAKSNRLQQFNYEDRNVL